MAGGTDKAATEASGVADAATALKPTDTQRKRNTSSSVIENSDDKKRKKQKKSTETTPTSKVPQEKNGSSKKKRKKKTVTTPTDKKSSATPTSFGSGGKVLEKSVLAEYSLKAKKRQEELKPGNEEQKERDARRMVAENCKELTLEVSNSMWPWTSEVTLSKDERTLYLLRNQVNHNTISTSLSNEITNNFLGNPIGADLNGKTHDLNMGADMKCILTHNTMVSVPLF